jgi:hypothetical protein
MHSLQQYGHANLQIALSQSSTICVAPLLHNPTLRPKTDESFGRTKHPFRHRHSICAKNEFCQSRTYWWLIFVRCKSGCFRVVHMKLCHSFLCSAEQATFKKIAQELRSCQRPGWTSRLPVRRHHGFLPLGDTLCYGRPHRSRHPNSVSVRYTRAEGCTRQRNLGVFGSWSSDGSTAQWQGWPSHSAVNIRPFIKIVRRQVSNWRQPNACTYTARDIFDWCYRCRS